MPVSQSESSGDHHAYFKWYCLLLPSERARKFNDLAAKTRSQWASLDDVRGYLHVFDADFSAPYNSVSQHSACARLETGSRRLETRSQGTLTTANARCKAAGRG